MYKDYSYYLKLAEQMPKLEEFKQHELLTILKAEKDIMTIKKIKTKLIESNYLTVFKFVPNARDIESSEYEMLFNIAIDSLIDFVDTYNDEPENFIRNLRRNVKDNVSDELYRLSYEERILSINEKIYYS